MRVQTCLVPNDEITNVNLKHVEIDNNVQLQITIVTSVKNINNPHILTEAILQSIENHENI